MISAVEGVVRSESTKTMVVVERGEKKTQTLVSLEEGKTKCIEEGDAFKEEHIPDPLDDRTGETSAAVESGEPGR